MRFIAAIDTRIYGISYAQGAEVNTSAWSRKQMLQYLGLGLIQANQVTAADITQAIVIQGDGVSTGTDGQGRLVVMIETPPQNIDWLTDVDTTAGPITDGSVLVWDEAQSLWRPALITDLPGGGGSMTLAGLTDVDTTGAFDGAVLVYEEISGTWVVGNAPAVALVDLSDVDATGILDGQTLIWDNSAQQFVAGDVSGTPGPAGPVAWAVPVAWNSATAYTPGPPASVVTYNGSAYVAIAPSTNQVPTNTTFWRLIVAKGEQGDQGDVGPASTVPGPPGEGVPAGGTAGQVLTKDSVTDYDTSWQDPATGLDTEALMDFLGTVGLVEGTGIELVYDDAANSGQGSVTITSTATGGGGPTFRGAWASVVVIDTLDLSSGVPAIFTSSTGFSTTSNPGGAGAPTGANVMTATANTGTRTATLTVPAGISKIRAKVRGNSGFGMQNSSNMQVGLLPFGGVFLSSTGGYAANTWYTLEVNVTPGDSRGLYAYAQFSDNVVGWWGQIELMGAPDPYMTGDSVIYNGKFYVSAVDTNASTPGANADWTELNITVEAADITDSGSTGRALVAAATAAAAKAVLAVVGEDAYSYVGPLATSIGQHRLYNDSGAARTITKARASVGTAPAGASIVVDVNIDGTTAFTSKPTIAAGANTGTATPSTATWPNGSYLTVDIDSVGSPGTTGSDLTVVVSYT